MPPDDPAKLDVHYRDFREYEIDYSKSSNDKNTYRHVVIKENGIQ